jgi:hypothetical protein
MTRQRAYRLLIGLALTAVSSLGVLYQVNESMASDSDAAVPRLLCPLH